MNTLYPKKWTLSSENRQGVVSLCSTTNSDWVSKDSGIPKAGLFVAALQADCKRWFGRF